MKIIILKSENKISQIVISNKFKIWKLKYDILESKIKL